jgi:hypothetical protein
MKLMVKRLANPLIVVVVVHSMAVAQTRSKTPPPVKSSTAVESTPKGPISAADEMREHQLRVFQEHVLARAIDNIKKMDEAGLRLSARNQILSYLGSDKAPSDDKQVLATQIARDALLDLREHHEEITPFMVSYLSNDLGSWIQKHRPTLIEEFEKTSKAVGKGDASQRIRSLFELEHGDVLASKRIRQELEDQGSLNSLYFWLDELLTRRSKEFEPVASDVVARAGQGQISFETLFWVSDIYLRPQVSNGVRNRFLTTVVARTQPANFITEPAPQLAHDLLTKLLPFIQQSTPELYDQAQNHSFAMRASLNERQLASDARIKRLKESVDPIGDLKSEAESAKTKAERNELLLHAAELALEKKKFQLCLDILGDIDVNVDVEDPNMWQRSVDQTLKNLVKACLTDKFADLAEKGATRIASTLTKTDALVLIMRYYTKASDKEAAQRFLIEASRVAASGPDNPDKAKAFFLLSVTCDQIDGSKKADLLLSGIKAMNNLSKPDANARDKSIYQTYVQRLDNSGHELTRGFKGLTRQDENSAMALVEKLQKPDLRTFALIGILLGVDGLLTEPAL